MTEAADLILRNAEVHTLADPDETHEAVAIRDGEIVAVDSDYEIDFLEGVETDVIDCERGVVLPGFVDAHTHVEALGRQLVHADLSSAEGREDALARLRAAADPDREWILGFGYDESEWDDTAYLTRDDLDRVSDDRPVVAMRVDLHTASVNGVALERLRASLPADDLEYEDGEPTGVVVEAATEVVREAIAPDVEETHELVAEALSHAAARGVTCVHDKVRDSHAPRVYRELDAAGDLDVRVRIDYWRDHLESAIDVGLATNAGSGFVRTGAIKTFTDGSIGGRTAKLSEPYADVPETEGRNDCGQWVLAPDELASLVERADDAGYQLSIHAIGDEAIDETVRLLEDADDPEAMRHRIEHAELAGDEAIERMAESGIVASMQPNFHRWADEGGLYDRRLGAKRRRRSNRFRTMLEAGVPLAFGSDCMPLDPLLGVHHAVNAPVEEQRLSVTEALRAYTHGAAYAGFDEDRLGTVEPGKRADLVVLEASPWEQPERIEEIDVATTLIDGDVVYDGR
ncbi:amidohydrolase [Natrialbaceae archaeon AArc-T1-2]|uniref:amidohydrolase n=1 Tax=Natrialbaceae archaeon AArc-T1-2 TaxID=3053904 RepID=UPI00255B219E|nr:amidohydrolase [Natrialbaceae archaeon AArc-T1-2]WIV66512.1 amidohydrolase [Natrialbaceae archaeon AArc-T1-2]